jgi:hypothetical protein
MMPPTFAFDPAVSAICAVAALADQSLEAHATRRPEQVRSNLPDLIRRDENAVRPAGKQPGEVCLPQRQWKAAKVVTVQRQDIECVQLDFGIMLAGIQGIEVGNTIDAQHHRFAVNDELLDPILQRRLRDPRISP